MLYKCCIIPHLYAWMLLKNVNIWPYMSIVEQDDNGITQAHCEALVIVERHDTYTFMLNSVFEMAPSFDKIKMHPLFGDKFLKPY